MPTIVKVCVIALPFILAFTVIFPLIIASKPHFEDSEEFLKAMETKN
jgi:hypothetical protein